MPEIVNDPLEAAHKRMQGMEKEELIKLVLIAANRVGIATHGDSQDPVIATTTFIDGINTVFSAYDTAVFNSFCGNKITWGHNYAADC